MDETVRAIVQGSVDTAREAAGGSFDALPGSPDEPTTSGDHEESSEGEGGGSGGDEEVKVVTPAKKEEKPAPKDVKKKDEKGDDDDPDVKDFLKNNPNGKKANGEPWIPLSVNRKSLNNARIKGAAESQETIKSLTSENEKLKERGAHADRWDSIIDSDQDGTAVLRELAKVRPHFAKYLNSGGTPEKKEAPSSSGFPKPDFKGADGSIGYTPEGFQRFIGWAEGLESRSQETAREAARSELKPITEREEQTKLKGQLDRTAQDKVKQATDIWGDLFTEDFQKGRESEVIQYAQKNKVTWETALQAILTPKLKKQHEEALLAAEQKSRDATIAELKKRSVAADNTDPTASGEPEEEKKNPSTRDIIAGVVKAHKHRARA